MTFDNLWNVLTNSVPPEITHYQHNEHPGPSWWLKTVIPCNPAQEIYQAWNAIQNKHSRFVFIQPTAYDWNQTLIPNAHSIWLNHKVDILIHDTVDGINYEIEDYDTSFNNWGSVLHQQILEQMSQKSKDFDPNNWQNLLDATKLMASWTTDRQARENRRSLKIVKPQKNTGASHNRSKLDTK